MPTVSAITIKVVLYSYEHRVAEVIRLEKDKVHMIPSLGNECNQKIRYTAVVDFKYLQKTRGACAHSHYLARSIAGLT